MAGRFVPLLAAAFLAAACATTEEGVAPRQAVLFEVDYPVDVATDPVPRRVSLWHRTGQVATLGTVLQGERRQFYHEAPLAAGEHWLVAELETGPPGGDDRSDPFRLEPGTRVTWTVGWGAVGVERPEWGGGDR